jgi:hypothetical protein
MANEKPTSMSLNKVSPQINIVRRFSQPDMLGERRRPKGSSAAHCAVNRALLPAFILNRHLDAGANRGAIRFDTHQVETDPVVAIAGIFKETEGMTVARDCFARRSAGLENPFLTAIASAGR